MTLVHAIARRALLLTGLFVAHAPLSLGSCTANGDEGKKAVIAVESCVDVKGVDVIAKANPAAAISDTPEKEALAALYDGRVVTGRRIFNAKNPKDGKSAVAGATGTIKVFLKPSDPSCSELEGKRLRGVMNYNCCDGDPGVPCLFEDVDAALDHPTVVKPATKAKQK